SRFAPLPLPEVIKAPRSIPRAVMMPANGASTLWKDWSAISRCTLASLAATLARAASTLASSAPRLACIASTLAWDTAVVALADVAAGTRVDRRLLDRLDVARQHEVDRPIGALRSDHAHLDEPGIRRRRGRDELGVLAQARHDTDDDEHREERGPDEKTPPCS